MYSHFEYNAKVISAETIARVLDCEAEQQSKVPVEIAKPAPEKMSTKKSAGKKPSAKKTSDKKSASAKPKANTTDKPAPKRSGGRKKKSDTPQATGESQVSTLYSIISKKVHGEKESENSDFGRKTDR